MSVIRYLLDEHVGLAYKQALKRRAPETAVWRIGDAGAPPLQSPDPFILE